MIRTLIAIPLLVVLIAFALSNQQAVQVGLWPTDILVEVPLSVAVLIAAGLFFVVGALMTWTGALALRSRARRAERQARDLQAQVEAMRHTQAQMRTGPMRTGAGMALLPPG